MKVISSQIVFQEVPNEISLSFLIAWCPLKCEGCHSKDKIEWKELTIQGLEDNIIKNKNFISCVLFLGWEWEKENLIQMLKICKEHWKKTCLYTWLLDVSNEIKENLDYLKVWPYIKMLWWLDSEKTNQKIYNVKTWESLNKYFIKK